MKDIRVVLVYSPQVFLVDETPRPEGSLGLTYLAGTLRDAGIRVRIMDGCVGDVEDPLECSFYRREVLDDQHVRVGLDEQTICSRLADADIVGVTSLFTAQTESAFAMARCAKTANPAAFTVAGGGNATALWRRFLDNGYDAVVMGEGEHAIVNIARRVSCGQDLDGVANVAWRRPDGTVVLNPAQRVITDLDELPMPAWDLLPLKKYWQIGSPHGGAFAVGEEIRYGSMETSRGCPYRCSFCHNSKGGPEARLRFKNLDRVLREVDVLRRLRVEYLFVEDDSVLANKARVRSLLSSLVERRVKIVGANGVNLRDLFDRCESGGFRVDVPLLETMASAGWVELALPFESGSQRILDTYVSRKYRHTNYDFGELIRAAARHGIRTYGFFTIGYPDETEDELRNTFLLAKRLVDEGLGEALFYIVTPYPGTALYDFAVKNGYLDECQDLRDMKFARPNMRNTTVPGEVLSYSRRLAYHLINSPSVVRRKALATIGTKE